MLRVSKIKLEVIGYSEMCNFFQKALKKGCLSLILERQNQTSIRILKTVKKRMTHVRYIDGNNLYGSLKLLDLPTDDYRFEDEVFIKEKLEKN